VTTVFYMGARTFAEMLPQMLAAGLPSDMPALAIAGATTATRTHVSAPVTSLPERLAELPAGVPVLIMVGRAMAAAHLSDHAARVLEQSA
jgi:uroporphyrin-III C-methyltransferase/precorrin-2 dehydrogenase/sirohydrochlorin ferrochelatase